MAEASDTRRQTELLSLGLPRTGSYSMALALTELGYKDVYHCIKTIDKPSDWSMFSSACDALFPALPSYNARGMSTADWERLFGPNDAITDIAGPFAESLIQCYPDAKVILVIRDYDRWSKSFISMLGYSFGFVPILMRDYVEPFTSMPITSTMQKIVFGWTGSKTYEEVVGKVRQIYDGHHDMVKKMVPEKQLLIYRLGSGWEPLCEFLDRPVPSVPFPHANDAQALKKTITEKHLRLIKQAAGFLGPYVLGLGAVAVGAWYAWF